MISRLLYRFVAWYPSRRMKGVDVEFVWPPEGFEESDLPPDDGELGWIQWKYDLVSGEKEFHYWRRSGTKTEAGP
jgi:hypothetical protein